MRGDPLDGESSDFGDRGTGAVHGTRLECSKPGAIATAVVAGLCVASGCRNGAKLPDAPVTARRAVNDVYHGVTVTDDYRWLEDSNDAAVKTWSERRTPTRAPSSTRCPRRQPFARESPHCIRPA